MRVQLSPGRQAWALVALGALLCPMARAAEHVTLKNGFELDCARQETRGNRIRLYLTSGSGDNYLEVDSNAVVRVDEIADVVPQGLKPLSMGDTYGTAKAMPLSKTNFSGSSKGMPVPGNVTLTKPELHTMLAHAGGEHNIDADLLASIVRAESGGHARAVSRVGAQGLMQLMPKTAGELGVDDAFRPEENIAGGTAYLDRLLTRYHDNVALALAAYNAGPAAVDRYHGVPPYRETRAYVARVIREFNRRKRMAGEQASRAQSNDRF